MKNYTSLNKPTKISEQHWPEGTVPLVSITCVTYNHVNFIRDAVEGFLIQETTFPVEIVIYDDASTDGTADIVMKYEAQYPRLIRGIYQKQNQYSKGRPARLFVWPMIRGAYIALCDGDDCWITKDKLEAQIQFLTRNPCYVLCFTRFETLDDESGEREFDKNSRYFSAESRGCDFGFSEFCHTGWHIGTQTMVYKKSAVNIDHFYNKEHYRDVFLITDLLLQGKGYCISDTSAIYRIHSGGIHNRVVGIKRNIIAERIYREIMQTYPDNGDLLKKYRKIANSLAIECIKERRFLLLIKTLSIHASITRDASGFIVLLGQLGKVGKQKMKKIPGALAVYRYQIKFRALIQELISVALLWLKSRRPVAWNPESNVIISLTSFPARIDDAWIAIESLFQQDFRPWKVVLVLSDEEFPTRELPKSILRQEARGLEILWTPLNTRSFQKLLPTREKYPDAIIVTADDDIIYEPRRLGQLCETAQRMPRSIVGHRGWAVSVDDIGLTPYVSWPAASVKTPPDRCFLTGVGLILYPPHVLPLDILLDVDLALKLCPTADDIWFWAVARKAEVACYCLGNHRMRPVARLAQTPNLASKNWDDGQNDTQLINVVRELGLGVLQRRADVDG